LSPTRTGRIMSSVTNTGRVKGWDPGGGRGGVSSRWAARLFVLVWLVYLAYPLSRVFSGGEGVSVVVQLSGAALFVAVYLWVVLFERPYWRGTDPRRVINHRVAVGTLSAVALSLSLLYGGVWAGLFVYASVAAGISLPSREARPVIAMLTVAVAVCCLASGMSWTGVGQFVLLVGGIGFGQVLWSRLFSTVRELEAAREEIARLAVAEERLRFARDLHDLLGHSLSLITVKSEVARKVADRDPRRATAEMREVEEIARRALGEVREAVSGYRRPALEAEIAGAAQMLEASGISCSVDLPEGDLPEAVRETFCWVIREAVTNVIRHSGARRCRISVGCEGEVCFVEVRDDGRGVVEGFAAGSGLVGLSERLRARGGTLLASNLPPGGFRVRAELPWRDSVPRAADTLRR